MNKNINRNTNQRHTPRQNKLRSSDIQIFKCHSFDTHKSINQDMSRDIHKDTTRQITRQTKIQDTNRDNRMFEPLEYWSVSEK